MSKKLWGGRFTKKMDKEFFKFQKSIQYDHKLAKYDITHSLIHVIALGMMRDLTSDEKNKLLKVLKSIRDDIKTGNFKFDKKAEDIHTDIQNKVEKKVGKLALKLHTVRSRNDQIAFDEKSYCHEKGLIIEKLLNELLKSINFLGNKYKKLKIVGYTHTQRAQKISFNEYLGAYYLMFERDKKRISNFWKNLSIHIGAGALAGSPATKYYSKAIGKILKSKDFLITSSTNPVDDVSDRDFIIEFLSVLSILQMHISRLAEDFILFSTKEFSFMNLPEEFCTGSSLMPHKKNPDFLELMRGQTGIIYGNLIATLTMMKGLPLTYNRDMQLNKNPLFSSIEIMEDELKLLGRFMKKITLNKKSIDTALKDTCLSAVDEAYKLVREKGISFKEAHDIIGRSIKAREKYL